MSCELQLHFLCVINDCVTFIANIYCNFSHGAMKLRHISHGLLHFLFLIQYTCDFRIFFYSSYMQYRNIPGEIDKGAYVRLIFNIKVELVKIIWGCVD